MKIQRRITEQGPRFTLSLDGAVEDYPAKYPGESAAIVEAQMAVLEGVTSRVQILDEGVVLYTVERGEDKAIRTYVGSGRGKSEVAA